MSLQTGDHEQIAQNVQDRTGTVLGFIHTLLQSAGHNAGSAESVLGDLAKAFGARAGGIAFGFNDQLRGAYRADDTGKAVEANGLPWEQRPELLREIKRAPEATEIVTTDGRWLATAITPAHGATWLLWVEDEHDRNWTIGEKSALPLAGQALARAAQFGNSNDFWSRILERARLQHQVENAASLTGKLAHDFGNVLTGILGFAELTLSQLPENSLPKQYLQEVWQSARRGAQWIHKLQTFSRRSAQQIVPARLTNIVAEEEARVRSLWGNRVTLVVVVTPDLPLLAVDAESIKQALAALLENAREAIGEQGVVSVSARTTELTQQDCLDLIGDAQPGRYVEISITDTGRGLSEDNRARMFAEAFYSTKTRHRGMGLAMVYGILRTFHGGIRYESAGERGTKVRLLLPATGESLPNNGPPRGNGERILVVDDDRVVLASVGQILHQAGYQVQTAGSTAEALAQIANGAKKFHLIVSDVSIADADGCELVKKLQEKDAGIAALFISSRNLLQGRACEEMLKKFDLLPKPFEPEALLRAVGKALARVRMS